MAEGNDTASIHFVTVTPRIPAMCHYIVNDGELHWMEYPAMLKYLQNLRPDLSAQFIDLFQVKASFILDVKNGVIEVLFPDEEERHRQQTEMISKMNNPTTAFQDHVAKELEKVPFELRMQKSLDRIVDDIYRRERR